MRDVNPDEIAVRWSAERAATARRAIHGALERPKMAPRLALGFVSVAAAAAIIALVATGWPVEGEQVARPAPATPVAEDSPVDDGILRFADGSWARPMGERSLAHKADDAATLARVDLASGGVEVEVTPNPSRTFEVVAGDVRVTVLGTHFEVEHDETRVRVRVTRGVVRVAWPGGEEQLVAGREGVYPPPSVDPPALEADLVEVRRPGRWRTQAERGEFERAYESLADEGFGTVRNTPEDLMLAADVARRSGHARHALPPLRRLLDAHASDARAPLAAFTLGRVLAEDLGEARDAARAFHTAQTLAPRGPLFGDAMVREAEALAASGDEAAGAEVASRYLSLFPSGRHAARAQSLVTGP